MRAALLTELNSTPQVTEVAEPVPRAGYSLVQVIAGSIAPTDLMRATGAYMTPLLPYTVGGEGVGRLADGTRVYFGHSAAPHGALCERTLVPNAELWPIPDALEDGLAIALGLSGTGALIPLEEARIRPGESVLILGATGPVGRIGLQVARALGAGRLTAAARTQAVLDALLAEGIADAVVQLGTGDDDAALRAAAGPGFDVVLDVIYGKPAEAAMRATRPGARMMSIGVQAGPTVTLSLRDLVMRSHIGVGTGQRPAAERRAAYDRLVRMALDGKLTLPITRFPLDQTAQAWEVQGRSPHSKIIVMMPS
jgi:NADPH:quinone reductase-like Zn-dependent oxidoreductase